MPDRCVRQLGWVQRIPRLRPLRAGEDHRPWISKAYLVTFPVHIAEDQWLEFPEGHIIPTGTPVPEGEDGAAAIDYIDWYQRHSHPRLLIADDAPFIIPARSNGEYVSLLLSIRIFRIFNKLLIFCVMTVGASL
jgi:hypothetical protein